MVHLLSPNYLQQTNWQWVFKSSYSIHLNLILPRSLIQVVFEVVDPLIQVVFEVVDPSKLKRFFEVVQTLLQAEANFKTCREIVRSQANVEVVARSFEANFQVTERSCVEAQAIFEVVVGMILESTL
jgi:hypothetical protein